MGYLERVQRLLVWVLIGILASGLLSFPSTFVASLEASPALAQRSGGGVGGRGGFRTSPTPSFPRVNPSPAPSYPTYPSYPRGGGYYPGPLVVGPGLGFGGGTGLVGILLFAGLIFVGFAMVRGLARAGSGGAGGAEAEAEVSRLRIATLYTPQLQTALRTLAGSADTDSTKGLADLVDDAAVLLLRDQAGWRFGSYETWRGSLEQAEGQFDQWMTQVRSESVETYRKFEGKVEQNTAYQPKAEPDGRYILVTFVVAAHGTLPDVPKPLRAAGAKQALMTLSSTTPVTMLAAYLAWTPEASGEALTEQDLLSGWPGLELL